MPRSPLWKAAPRPLPALAPGTVQIWRADLDDPEAPHGELSALLDEAERERAARFRLERDRRRFSVGRGILRLLLAASTGLPAGALRLRYGRAGKPELDTGEASRRLAFNLSHSRGRALFALAWERELGVDVEAIRGDRPRPALLRRALSPAQAAAIGALPESERAPAFHRLWALNEAYAKATGEGILGLDRSPLPARLDRGFGFEAGAPGRHWWAEPLDPGPGYAAVLVVEGAEPGSLSAWQWAWP